MKVAVFFLSVICCCLSLNRVPLYRMKSARATLEVIHFTITRKKLIINYLGDEELQISHCKKMAQ